MKQYILDVDGRTPKEVDDLFVWGHWIFKVLGHEQVEVQ